MRHMTRPLNGQYPRPWMTDLADPGSARVFIVGRNQAKTYDAGSTTHERHIDALFNRNGESCRALYAELTGGRASATRQNTDDLRAQLAAHGVESVLETNVVCYSTPMSLDLGLPQHQGGKLRGSEIFRALVSLIRPSVMIAHGKGTVSDLGQVLGIALPIVELDNLAPEPLAVPVGGMIIFPIPSLAPPEANKWDRAGYLPRVARAVGEKCAS